MGKYFGTDGIRGVYGKTLDDRLAFRTGAALVRHFGKGEYVIVRDPRESGPAIEDAVIAGTCAAGGSVIKGGILPTPAAAFLVKKHGAAAGLVISASHNPPEYNGIKIFDGRGLKIDESAENAIEAFIDSGEDPQSGTGGSHTFLAEAEEEYINYLTNEVPINLSGLHISLDCAFGACGGGTAKKTFERLGASVTAYNNDRDGTRINKNCGAVHPALLIDAAGKTPSGVPEIGFAFDGDGDRLAVVIDGKVLDGDTVLYNLAHGLNLSEKAVVGTILSNLALEEKLVSEGMKFYRTPVGDKHIAKKLFENGFSLGGEQSGHFILNRGCLTGDAILSALYLLKSLYSGGTLKAYRTLSLYPQIHLSRKADKSILADAEFVKLVEKSKKRLGAEGRIITRMSGTEPIVRIMAEGRNDALVVSIINDFEDFFDETD